MNPKGSTVNDMLSLLWQLKVNPRKLEHGFRRSSARIPILYVKGMRIMMFQLSGFCFYCKFTEWRRLKGEV